MRFLVTSDLHFTDVPQDNHRFGIFDFLSSCLCGHDAIFVLGDITDKKDHHSSLLVNKIVNGFSKLSLVIPIYILMGNHDYISKETPFFGFLNNLNNVFFIKKPGSIIIEDFKIDAVPNGYDPKRVLRSDDGEILLLHHSVFGCTYSNGQKDKDSHLKVIDFAGYPLVLSGDIHKPQKLGDNFYYVGSPYNINYGDGVATNPRILDVLYHEGEFKLSDLNFNTITRHTINIYSLDDLEDVVIDRNDQIKIRFMGDLMALGLESIREGIIQFLTDKGVNFYKIEYVDTSKARKQFKEGAIFSRDDFDRLSYAVGVGPNTEEHEIGKGIENEADRDKG